MVDGDEQCPLLPLRRGCLWVEIPVVIEVRESQFCVSRWLAATPSRTFFILVMGLHLSQPIQPHRYRGPV